jgi:DNA recombination protein RmuC
MPLQFSMPPTQVLLLILAGLQLLVIVLLLILLVRGRAAAGQQFKILLDLLQRGQGRATRDVRQEIAHNREEISRAIMHFGDSLQRQIAGLTQSNETRFDRIRDTVDVRLRQMQQSNAERLEEMRQTVDEKLQGALERRLGESFKIVSERLEQVHAGLGEMRTLAGSVGDLKRVLTNVKTRGTWGEVQLGAILEQLLMPDQYAANFAPGEASDERVEFAIRLPGRAEDGDQPVWLPIDAKFPQEDYLRLLEAQERAQVAAVEASARALEARVRQCGRDICSKYLHPPRTTDFAIMFLPTEGLYAETVRRPGLVEALQRDCRVVVAGPTTLAALLNSLQMGFRTLAIEKRSSEVWNLLGQIRSEFGKFGDLLDGVRKKLEVAGNSLEDATRKTRTIERKLRKVQEIPSPSGPLISLGTQPQDGDYDT